MNTKTKKPPDPWKEKKKLLITAIKKTVKTNGVLPILEEIVLDGTNATVSDLETFVVIPFEVPGVNATIPADRFIDCLEMMDKPSFACDKNFGISVSEGKRLVKVMGQNPNDFPKIWGWADYNHIGTFGEAELGHLATALSFVSNDDLRPAMTGVLCGEVICATDAHRLFWKDIEPLLEHFILAARPAKILLALGGEKWELYSDGTHVLFLREDGVMLVTRVIDARFPDYKVVIPDPRTPGIKMTVDKEVLLKEIKNAVKFSNRSTNLCAFTLNGKLEIASQDIDFSFEYQNEIEGAEIKFYQKNRNEYTIENDPDGDTVSKVKKLEDGKWKVNTRTGTAIVDEDRLVPVPDYMQIAFNGNFLSEIIHKVPKEELLVIKMWSPTKAAIINDQFLVMPLMLNQ